MKKTFIFLFIFAVLLVLLLSPFASKKPDGLERVAIDKEFDNRQEEKPVLKAPLPDYSIPVIKNEAVSTVLSGIIGALITFILVFSAGYLFKKRKKSL